MPHAPSHAPAPGGDDKGQLLVENGPKHKYGPNGTVASFRTPRTVAWFDLGQRVVHNLRGKGNVQTV